MTIRIEEEVEEEARACGCAHKVASALNLIDLVRDYLHILEDMGDGRTKEYRNAVDFLHIALNDLEDAKRVCNFEFKKTIEKVKRALEYLKKKKYGDASFELTTARVALLFDELASCEYRERMKKYKWRE